MPSKQKKAYFIQSFTRAYFSEILQYFYFKKFIQKKTDKRQYIKQTSNQQENPLSSKNLSFRLTIERDDLQMRLEKASTEPTMVANLMLNEIQQSEEKKRNKFDTIELETEKQNEKYEKKNE